MIMFVTALNRALISPPEVEMPELVFDKLYGQRLYPRPS
jgi:hypothetical protein